MLPSDKNVDLVMRPGDFSISRPVLDLCENYLDGDNSQTAQEIACACAGVFSGVADEDLDEDDESRCAELIDRLDAQLDSETAVRAEQYHRAIIDEAVRKVAQESGTQFVILETIAAEYHNGAPVDIDVIDDLLLAANSDGEFIVRSKDVLLANAEEALKIAIANVELSQRR